MPNNQNQYQWGQGQTGGRVPSPQRPVQPTGFEPLAALAQSWLGKKQAEERGLQGAFPALVSAGVIRPPTTGETPTFQLGGMPWVTQPPKWERVQKGFTNPEDIPDTYKGLPLRSVNYSPTTGTYIPTYGKAGEPAVVFRFGDEGRPKLKKYPTKKKYGRTYEKREDGKWHLIK